MGPTFSILHVKSLLCENRLLWLELSTAGVEGVAWFLAEGPPPNTSECGGMVFRGVISHPLGANRKGKGRVKGKASRIQSSRIGSALVCVRRNAQHPELKLPESTRFVLNTVLMVAVSTRGPTGASPPPLSSRNIQSHEQSFTSPRARGEAPTMSFVLGTNPEGKERVKGKASLIPSSRIGSALGCVRRNAQHLELKLLEST